MKPRSSTKEDPVVAEVRAIRAELWREAGGTVEGLLKLIGAEHRARQRRRPQRARRTRTN